VRNERERKENRYITKVEIMAKRRRTFTQIPHSIIFEPRLTSAEFRIIVLLISFNPTFPSHRNIAKWTGLNKDTVNRVLQGLRKKNVLAWKRGNSYGRNNEYRLNPQGNWFKEDCTDFTPQTTRKTNDPIILIKGIGELELKNLSNFDPDSRQVGYSKEDLMEYLEQTKNAV
jgi:DNA-binding MarR family transcriptional regulator